MNPFNNNNFKKNLNLNFHFINKRFNYFLEKKYYYINLINDSKNFNLEFIKNSTYSKQSLKTISNNNNLYINNFNYKNNFLNFSQRGYFQKYLLGYFDNPNIKQINKEEETIIIYEPTTFKRKKFCVLYLNSKIPQIISISSFIGLNFIQVFSLYKLLLGLYYFKFIAPIFWGYLSLLIMRINIKVNKNREHIIIKINLLKDGNTCEIVTLRRKFKIDLNLIRKMSIEEKVYMKKDLDYFERNYISLIIDSKLYLIPNDILVPRVDLLAAVLKAKCIKFEEKNQVNKKIKI